MRKLLIVAILTAACTPIPPVEPKRWDVKITVDGQEFPYSVETSRPVQHLQKDVAYCSEFVHTQGIESFKGCLSSFGYRVDLVTMK